ncbi:MAG: NADH-quinone oxidoreductase subunit J [Ardenticatenaceae bacterium]|nr:NADH-quinone oxidoreductase subunit J [Ardenticatenaceae bacterium]MCB8949461.1 NADH-quinone oxidoreductase subunit J [Ardenticatenaceae bacterium]
MLQSIVYGILAVGMIVGALQAIRAPRLITAALWLAAVSMQLAVMLFLLGAPDVAVIELSVGAGLVTVLFVFAISVAGELTEDLPTIVPRPLAASLILFVIILLTYFILPAPTPAPAAAEADFATVMWEQRAVDVWLQVALIFAGVLGLLGLLTEELVPVKKPVQVQPEEPVFEEVADVPAH